eukprot:gene8615-6047_t
MGWAVDYLDALEPQRRLFPNLSTNRLTGILRTPSKRGPGRDLPCGGSGSLGAADTPAGEVRLFQYGNARHNLPLSAPTEGPRGCDGFSYGEDYALASSPWKMKFLETSGAAFMPPYEISTNSEPPGSTRDAKRANLFLHLDAVRIPLEEGSDSLSSPFQSWFGQSDTRRTSTSWRLAIQFRKRALRMLFSSTRAAGASYNTDDTTLGTRYHFVGATFDHEARVTVRDKTIGKIIHVTRHIAFAEMEKAEPLWFRCFGVMEIAGPAEQTASHRSCAPDNSHISLKIDDTAVVHSLPKEYGSNLLLTTLVDRIRSWMAAERCTWTAQYVRLEDNFADNVSRYTSIATREGIAPYLVQEDSTIRGYHPSPSSPLSFFSTNQIKLVKPCKREETGRFTFRAPKDLFLENRKSIRILDLNSLFQHFNVNLIILIAISVFTFFFFSSLAMMPPLIWVISSYESRGSVDHEQNRKFGFFWQMKIAIIRIILLAKRKPIGLICELLIPIVFVAGAVFLWDLLSHATAEGVDYYSSEGLDESALFYSAVPLGMCYENEPVGSLRSCSFLKPFTDPRNVTRRLMCSKAATGAPAGVCGLGITGIVTRIGWRDVVARNSSYIPSIDELVPIQWMNSIFYDNTRYRYITANSLSACVSDLVLSQLPEAGHLGSTVGEMMFSLPMSSKNKFSSLLVAIEEAIEGNLLGVTGYSLAATTLEEVFLHVVQDAENEDHGLTAEGDENHVWNISGVATEWTSPSPSHPMLELIQPLDLQLPLTWTLTKNRHISLTRKVCLGTAVCSAMIHPRNAAASVVAEGVLVWALNRENYLSSFHFYLILST